VRKDQENKKKRISENGFQKMKVMPAAVGQLENT
jgi:hypothetical protein